MPSSKPDLTDRIRTFLQAGREHLRTLKGGGRIVYEGGAFGDTKNDTETAADIALGAFYRDKLLAEVPNMGRISIESSDPALKDQRFSTGSALWATCDPLDGSLNYRTRGNTGGLPYSSVITILDVSENATFNNVIAAGIIDCRNSDLWLGHKDALGLCHATVNDFQARTAQEEKLDLGRMIVIGEFYYPDNRAKLVHAFEGEKGWLRNPGSAAYEMALVASGQAVAFICDRQKQHELGAAYLLTKAAGGVAIDFEGKDIGPRTYDFVSQTPVILACNMAIAEQILERLHLHR